VYGSNGAIALNSAQAGIVGGGDTVYLDGSASNVASLSNTGDAWDGVYGSNGAIGLNNGQAGVTGDDDIFYFAAAHDANWLAVNGANETFVFQSTFGNDAIVGFNSSDAMQFAATDFADWSALLGHMSQQDANTVITLDAGATITLVNTQMASLTASQFHFS
jgi:hypothetical protein